MENRNRMLARKFLVGGLASEFASPILCIYLVKAGTPWGVVATVFVLIQMVAITAVFYERPYELLHGRVILRQPPGVSGLPVFPRLWYWFRFLLPGRVQDRIFEPLFQEFLEDYTLAKAQCRTPWEARWITFCFTCRTAFMVTQCLFATIWDMKVGWFFRLIGR